MSKVSVIIPARCEVYLQPTIDSVLERARGDVEVIPIIDGYKPDPPLIVADDRVKPIYVDPAIGQRAGYNLGVEQSSGDFIMKIDGHALMSPGFDEILKESCGDKDVVLPRMCRLDVRKWDRKNRGKTDYMFFGMDLYCHFWRDFRKRPQAKGDITEVMTGQGSCWFVRRAWNDYIGLLDERCGSWGKVGIEVALRTWLCGGQHIVNKQVWQAHYFRKDEGGFPYPFSGRNVAKARNYAHDNWYFKETGAFPNQVRPFSWLMDKFKPIPGWEVYESDRYTANRIIIYYTDSQLEETLARSVRKQLERAAGPIPIISVSQKPLKFGSKNICVGPKPRNYTSLYEQMQAGVLAAPPNSVVYLAEHDVFYHPSHFVKIPRQKDAFYFNRNRYYWRPGLTNYVKARGTSALSQAVCYREYLLKHIDDRLEAFKADPDNAQLSIRRFKWESARPNVDVRHGQNFTKDGPHKARYYRGKEEKTVTNIGGWGSPKHLMSKVSYRGPLQRDIIQWLIDQNGYKSYLEIGVRKKGTFAQIEIGTKHGVDPKTDTTFKMNSDQFFVRNHNTYDIVFVDGLHEAEQAYRDIVNSLRCLNDNGVIVVHDCRPLSEKEQLPERNGLKRWTGDVWKAFARLRVRPDLTMCVIDTNSGIGIIRPGQQQPLNVPEELTYRYFENHKENLLNLVSVYTWRRRESA